MSLSEGLLLSQQAAGGQGGIMNSLLLFAPLALIFYFVMWRPQQKEAKEQAALLASLQKGDRVVTLAGLHGKVHEVKADTLVLEIAPSVVIVVDRDAVRRKATEAKAETPAKGA